MSRIRLLKGIRSVSSPPAWLLGLVATIAMFVVANLWFYWALGQIPLGHAVAVDVVSAPNEVQVEKFHNDLLPNCQYRLAYGMPITLTGQITPTANVEVFVNPGTERSITPAVTMKENGVFTSSLPEDLRPGDHQILIEGPWGIRQKMCLIYRPHIPFEDNTLVITRTLSATLLPDHANLLYQIQLPLKDDRGQTTVPYPITDLMQNELATPIFLKWLFYTHAREPRLEASRRDLRRHAAKLNQDDGEQQIVPRSNDLTAIAMPTFTIDKEILTINVAALVRSDDYTESLNRLLAVSPTPGSVRIEIQTKGVQLTTWTPIPKEIDGTRWRWEDTPVTLKLDFTAVSPLSETPGRAGIVHANTQLDTIGKIITILLILLLPLIPFLWWGRLVYHGVAPEIPIWPIWLGFLLWAVPIAFLIVHSIYNPESSFIVVIVASLAMAILILFFPTRWSGAPSRREVGVHLAVNGAAILAIPILAFTVQWGLRESWFVAAAAALLLLALVRLLTRSLHPDYAIKWFVWAFLWVLLLPLVYPLPIDAFGFAQGVGWPPETWSQFFIIVGIYCLPYIVLALILRTLYNLDSPPAQLEPVSSSQKKRNYLAISKIFFVFFLIGATRGLAPGVTTLQPLFPLAFVLAFVAHGWLFPKSNERGKAILRQAKEKLGERDALIQKALDLEWSRNALTRLLQKEDPDAKAYEEKRTSLINQQKAWRTEEESEHDIKPEELIFAYGPYESAWKNGIRGGGFALIVGAALLLIYLPAIFQRTDAQVLPFVFFATIALDILPLLAKWVLLGFFLGCFFPYIRGNNGWQKGLFLALAVVACTVPHDLLNGNGLESLPAIGLDVAQVVLLLTVMGLLVFDLKTLQQNGHGWRRLLIVHNMSFLAGFGALVATAIVSTVTGLITGRLEPILNMLLNLLSPGNQPPF